MAADYVVTNQRQTNQVVGGQFQTVMEVTFQTTSGVTGSVTVPVAQYNPENVANLIQARVDQINAVGQI
jgi:hypothetical protein